MAIKNLMSTRSLPLHCSSEPIIALPIDPAPITPVVSNGPVVNVYYGHWRPVTRRTVSACAAFGTTGEVARCASLCRRRSEGVCR